MATLGYNDLKNVVRLPSTWDLDYLRRFNGRDGSKIDFVTLTTEIGTAFNAFNASLVAPTNYWSRYVTTTSAPEREYVNGDAGGELEPIGEYSRMDGIKTSTTGHMIPMRDYGGALGYTYWALRRGTLEKARLPIQTLIERGYTTWEKRLLTRLFSKAVDTVGATGKSVPFADGGTADSSYVPRAYNGTSFDTSHQHYLRYTNDDAGRASFLQAGGEHLRHHGVMGPYTLEVSRADMSTWTALNVTGAKFIKPQRAVVVTTGIEVRSNVDESLYIGTIETDNFIFYVHLVDRLQTGYAGIFAPGGFGAVNNPLLVRYEEGYPLGLTLLATPNFYPLEEAQAAFTFGAGIGNRDVGVLGKFASSGSYTDPTIS